MLVYTVKNKSFEYTPVYAQKRIEINSEESQPSEPPPQQEEYVIPKEEWYLKLVNKDNPLTKDYIIPTKAINSNGYYFDERAMDMLNLMFADGAAAGLKFKISSGYRTIERQDALYQQAIKNIVATGKTQEEATQIAAMQVAPPGTSEHNLGLGLDIISANNPATIEAFEKTPEFAWLVENAKNYGFILRYPKDKENITKVAYEPWHFRFVGSVDAKRMYEQGVCLEEYLA